MAKTDEFEVALKELEEIVKRIEEGKTNLDEMIELYEKGKKLSKRCLALLETAQDRVTKLMDQGDELQQQSFLSEGE